MNILGAATQGDPQAFDAVRGRNHSWQARQVHTAPLTTSLRKRNDWLQGLDRVCDEYAHAEFRIATTTCFTFAVDALDAMLGTQLRAKHEHVLGDNRKFRPHVDKLAADDYFDALGPRIKLEDLELGDLVQLEIQNGLRVQYHWAVQTPHGSVGFDTTGLTTATQAFVGAQKRAYVKCWRIG